MPKPARMTVFPLLPGDQANPRRGANWWWSSCGRLGTTGICNACIVMYAALSASLRPDAVNSPQVDCQRKP